jgi:glycosyltransferase involved in cell wall biosynthesis
MMPFSLTLSVYKNDNPEYFEIAINSILNQSIPPDEIVLTIDGPIPDILDNIINIYKSKIQCLNIIRLSQNRGLGIAHQIGVEHCTNSLIAMMDSDDISVPDRFEKQLKYFEKNKDVDVIGGYISEFIDNIENTVGIRNVPLNDVDIKKYLKKRCPLNHMTVMFKKESVLKSGSYQDWYFNEDYYLWCRMLLNGCKFGNIPAVLVYVRVGNDMYKRRGGWRYFRSEAKLQLFMLNNKIINVYEYLINILIRFIIQIIMPNRVRGFIFRNLMRIKNN